MSFSLPGRREGDCRKQYISRARRTRVAANLLMRSRRRVRGDAAVVAVPAGSDHFRLAQRSDFFPRIAKLEENLLGVLTVLRRRIRLSRNLAVERYRTSGHRHLAGFRMVEVEQVAIGARLFAVEHLLMRRDFGRHDVGRGELGEPFVRGLIREDTVSIFSILTPRKLRAAFSNSGSS
jgi:hypothetical protein